MSDTIKATALHPDDQNKIKYMYLFHPYILFFV